MRCIVANLVDGGGNELAEVGNIICELCKVLYYLQIHAVQICYALYCKM